MESFIFYAVVFRTLSEAMIEIKETSVAKIMLISAALKNVISSKEPNDWSYANSFSKFCVQS